MSHGQLENISDSGLGILLVNPICVGTKIEVRSPYGNYSGTVVRSLQKGEECYVGIKRDA